MEREYRSGAGAWVAALVAVVVGAVAWRGALDWSLLGWDSYPMIWAGRITDLASCFGTFTEELMDGRYPLGHFWRPVVHFAFALDHAIWGLDPFGYHLSDLIVLLVSAALTALLVERLAGGARPGPAGPAGPSGLARLPIGGLIAGLAFCLHPLHFEVLPVAPRRADGLAVLFTLLALHGQLGALSSTGRRGLRYAWVGLCCALALGSKETGAIAPAAVVLLTWCLPAVNDEAGARSGRLARTLRASWPAALGFGLALILRTVALGGLGGGNESSLSGGFARAPELARVFARALFFPDTVFGLGPDQHGPVWAALAGAAALGLLLFLRGDPRVRGALLFLALWAVALIPLTGMSDLPQGWYAFPYLPVFALGAGLVAAAGLRGLAAGRGPLERLGAVLGVSAGVALAVVAGLGSPLVDDADDFARASEYQTEFLTRFERRLGKAQPGQTLSVQNCPVALRAERLVYIVASYSLEAWADLTLGEGRARVNLPGLPPSTRAPGPDVIDVVAFPPPSGYVE